MKKKRTTLNLGQLAKHLEENRPLTTFEVSKICGVVHSTVSNWIDEGKLDAYRTPGGHRRVKKQSLVAFLKKYGMPVSSMLSEPEPEPEPAAANGHPPAAPEAPPKEEPALPGNDVRKKILIVEDDRDVSEFIAEVLGKSLPNSQLTRAYDGFEAGKQIVAFAPDLVILDLILPGVDGFRVLSNLRQDKKTSGIKIIALTGYDNRETRERILQAGDVDGFISKPLDLRVLREKVAAVFHQNGDAPTKAGAALRKNASGL